LRVAQAMTNNKYQMINGKLKIEKDYPSELMRKCLSEV